MNARFHAPDARSGASITLSGEEGRHLARVLRLKTGDAVSIFDGRGAEFEAVIARIAGDTVEVQVGTSKATAPEARVALTLAQAVLKGDAMDDVVRDAVMMGVAAVQPILTTRTEVSRATLERARRRERWERIAVASVKQCGRAVVPPIHAPLDAMSLPEALAARRLPVPAFLLVEPSADVGVVALRDLDVHPPREALLVIGPEGGWAPAEVDGLAGACRPIAIGPRTIRANAMATVAMAALFAKWDEF